MFRGKAREETLQGYLRSSTQIEQIWEQCDEQVQNLLLEGKKPWEAFREMGYALAFVRACRLNVLFVQELLKATLGKGVPDCTFAQAEVVAQNIEPMLEEAIKACLPGYVPGFRQFPFPFGPHFAETKLPVSHLQGMRQSVQEVKTWVEGILAQYRLELTKVRIPEEIQAHLDLLKNRFQLAGFHAQSGIDMIGLTFEKQPTMELLLQAESVLWKAMEEYYELVQVMAFSKKETIQPVLPQVLSEKQKRTAGELFNELFG